MRVSWAAHGALAAWVVLWFVLAEVAPLTYDAALQEDRFVEWLTVALFGAAAVFALRRALRRRRVFDGLVGAFCVFVAGEEFSWGQRLLGITPPDAFLEHNRQQELTLHNFAEVFGEPKWVLILALVGFGVVLPLVARTRAQRLADRVGATAAPRQLIPWFAGAAGLLLWYPLSFTGEWVEALAGAAFLLAFTPSARALVVALGGGVSAALAMSLLSARGGHASPAELACARVEASALLNDLAFGSAATGRLVGATSVHKRVFTAIEEGYVRADRLADFDAAPCAGDDEAAERRRHAIDPWGTAYWIDMERADGEIRARVYSFGPNRRRDPGAGDDVAAAVAIDPLSGEVTRSVDHSSSVEDLQQEQ